MIGDTKIFDEFWPFKICLLTVKDKCLRPFADCQTLFYFNNYFVYKLLGLKSMFRNKNNSFG